VILKRGEVKLGHEGFGTLSDGLWGDNGRGDAKPSKEFGCRGLSEIKGAKKPTQAGISQFRRREKFRTPKMLGKAITVPNISWNRRRIKRYAVRIEGLQN